MAEPAVARCLRGSGELGDVHQSLLLAHQCQYHAAIGQSLLTDFPEIAAAQPELVAHSAATGVCWNIISVPVLRRCA